MGSQFINKYAFYQIYNWILIMYDKERLNTIFRENLLKIKTQDFISQWLN